MAPEPTPSSDAATERRPAVWPWLLIPLVALTFFYVLHTAKEAPRKASQHTESSSTEAPPPSEPAESR
jgi:hypothetical protein